jgi:hypothetical protein
VLLSFEPQTVTAADTIRVTIYYLRCGDTLSRAFTLTFPINRNADSAHAVLTVTTSSVSLGNQALVDVSLSGLPATSNVEQFDLYMTYDHNVLTYDHSDLAGTLTGTWPPTSNMPGVMTDDLHFPSLAPLGTTPGILAHLWFKTFVADSSYTPIAVTGSFYGMNGGCPIIFVSPLVSTLRRFRAANGIAGSAAGVRPRCNYE